MVWSSCWADSAAVLDYQNPSLQMMWAIILGSSGLVRICSFGLKVWDPEEVKGRLGYSLFKGFVLHSDLFSLA